MSQRIDRHTIWAAINDSGNVMTGKGCRSLAARFGCSPRWNTVLTLAKEQGWQVVTDDVTALQLNKHRVICVLKSGKVEISTYTWMRKNYDDVKYTIGVTVR